MCPITKNIYFCYKYRITACLLCCGQLFILTAEKSHLNLISWIQLPEETWDFWDSLLAWMSQSRGQMFFRHHQSILRSLTGKSPGPSSETNLLINHQQTRNCVRPNLRSHRASIVHSFTLFHAELYWMVCLFELAETWRECRVLPLQNRQDYPGLRVSEARGASHSPDVMSWVALITYKHW